MDNHKKGVYVAYTEILKAKIIYGPVIYSHFP